MAEKEHLLTSKQMARFVADGFLRFDELVPTDLNAAAFAEMEKGEIPRAKGGVKLSELWGDQAIGQIVRLPQIQGIIQMVLDVHQDPQYALPVRFVGRRLHALLLIKRILTQGFRPGLIVLADLAGRP